MKATARRPKPLAFNITPLIDVTFLLIIFFIMSNKLIQEELSLEMILPRETSGENLKDEESEKIVINIESADSLFYGAKKVDMSGLSDRLTKEKKRSKNKKAVRIRANRDVPYSTIEPVLVLCAKTGYTDVSFAVVDR